MFAGLLKPEISASQMHKYLNINVLLFDLTLIFLRFMEHAAVYYYPGWWWWWCLHWGQLRGQTLMFRGRGGSWLWGLSPGYSRSPPDTDVLQLQSQFPPQSCANMCSWGILSLANDPISLSAGGVGVWGSVCEGVLMMRQLTWQNNHINAPCRHGSEWALALTCSIIWLLLTNLILQMEMCVFTRKNQHNYEGNLSKVKASLMEEYSDVTLEMNEYVSLL